MGMSGSGDEGQKRTEKRNIRVRWRVIIANTCSLGLVCFWNDGYSKCDFSIVDTENQKMLIINQKPTINKWHT